MPPRNSPYSVLVRDLVHRPGEHRELSVDVTVPERLGEGVAYVPADATLHLDLRLESLHDGILVTAEVDTTAVAQCVRCLDDITLPTEVEFQELFAYSVDEAFDYAVHDDHVDLEGAVRDAVVLSLPFQPVCRPDCPGLDPETGERLADDPDREPRVVIDPRWAALQGFAAGDADDQEPQSSATEKR